MCFGIAEIRSGRQSQCAMQLYQNLLSVDDIPTFANTALLHTVEVVNRRCDGLFCVFTFEKQDLVVASSSKDMRTAFADEEPEAGTWKTALFIGVL